jgi:hypothetical protein
MRALRVGLAALALLALSVAGGRAATALPAATITVNSVFPSSQPQGAAYQDEFISGSGFVDGDKVSFGTGVTVHSVSIESPDDMTVSVSVSTAAALTARDVVITRGTVSGTCTACFSVSDTPVVNTVSNLYGGGVTASLPQGSVDQILTIGGADFMPGATVSFGALSGVAVAGVNYQGPYQLQVTVSVSAKAAIQSDDVTVTNKATGSPSGTCAACFAVSDTPIVQSLYSTGGGVPIGPGTAPTLPQGAAVQQLVVNGENFMPGATVSFGATSGVTVSTVAFNSSTALQITVSVSAKAPIQSDDVTVTNKATGSPSGACPACFAVSDTPSVQFVSGNGVGLNGPELPQGAVLQSLLVEGADFMPKATVSFGAGSGIAVTAVAYEGPFELQVTVSVSGKAPLQSDNVTVTNKVTGSPAGTCSGCFTVSDTPSVDFVSTSGGFGPFGASLPQGAAFQTVDLDGSNFMPKATVSFGAGSGVTVNSVVYQGPTQLQVTVSVSATALLQTDDITVTNKVTGSPSGTCFGCLTVSDTPSIFQQPGLSLSPGTKDTEVYVYGSDFQPGATASFSPGTGVKVNSVRYEGSGTLVINLTVTASAPAQTDDLTVTNPKAPAPNSATSPGFLVVT